ncbi:MAG: hypothetical protein Q8O74_00405, partial [bacterium]|nr:hypothetical protein [bacterium]
ILSMIFFSTRSWFLLLVLKFIDLVTIEKAQTVFAKLYSYFLMTKKVCKEVFTAEVPRMVGLTPRPRLGGAFSGLRSSRST